MEHEIIQEIELAPKEIIAAIPRMQKKGLSGDKLWSDPDRWKIAINHPNQYAISLSGEPTLYSHLPELIDLLCEAGNSVFVVSNGTIPQMIQKIRPTQLYLSLDASNFVEYTKLCRPMEKPATLWHNILTSLSLLKQKEEDGVRTALRTTLVKGYNDGGAADIASLVRGASPRFVEIKGYMYLGYSRMRLPKTAVPNLDEIRSFARTIAEHADYQILDENAHSRVVCLVRKP
jgi:tRNA wybutosine-synthesizing protein 1